MVGTLTSQNHLGYDSTRRYLKKTFLWIPFGGKLEFGDW